MTGPLFKFEFFCLIYRLRMGMERSPQNWRNCAMYVQDLVRPDVNVTADVSVEAFNKFKKICNKFVMRL